MLIGFPATIPGCLHAHQTCIQAILHIAHQLAIFDEHIIARGRAFIIDVNRAPTVFDRAIIDNRNARRGHLFPHPS